MSGHHRAQLRKTFLVGSCVEPEQRQVIKIDRKGEGTEVYADEPRRLTFDRHLEEEGSIVRRVRSQEWGERNAGKDQLRERLQQHRIAEPQFSLCVDAGNHLR